MLYLCHVTGSILQANGWRRSISLPSFLLDSDIQGIVNCDHAKRIAEGMLSELLPEDKSSWRLFCHVVPYDPYPKEGA